MEEENNFENSINPIFGEINPSSGYNKMPEFIPIEINTGPAPTRYSPIQKQTKGNKLSNNPFSDFEEINQNDGKLDSVLLDSYSNNKRYSKGTRPGDNWEEQYAQNQSTFDKAKNGILKGVNLAATTVVGSFGMIGGLVQAGIEGDISKVWDNPVSQNLEKWNKYVDSELLPNFYTEKEANADLISFDNLWSANFVFDKVIKNSGFAVGAMLSGNIANAAIKGLGFAIGEAAVAGRALTAGEEIMSAELGVAETMKAYSPLLNKIARGFSQAKNVEIKEALDAYAKLTIGDTVKLTAELAKINSAAAKYTNIGGKVGRGIVAAYSSAGESSMEALMGGNALKEKLTAEYINQNGQEPTGEALENITKQVKSFGKTSFSINMALLGVTEYAQLPYLTGSSWGTSFRAAKKEIDDVIAKTVAEGVENTGELIAKTATTRAGKVLAGIKKYGQYVFDPKEGAQEILQYATEIGTSNYYEKASKNTNAQDWVESANYGLFGTDKTGKAVGAFNSKEGLEGGLIGAFTGGLMMAKGTYAEEQEKNKNTTQFLQEANNAPKIKEVLKHKINSINILTEHQTEQQEAVKNNDISESKNKKADIMFNYAMHKVRYGKIDMVMADLNDMLEGANDVDTFAEYINEGVANKEDTPKTFSARVNELKTFTEALDKTYDDLNTVYGNLTTTNKEGKLERKYTDDALEKLSYAQTKLGDYSTRITQLTGQLGSQNVMTFDLVNKIKKNEKIEDLDTEINKLVEGSTAQTETEKTQVKNKIEDVLSMTVQQKQFLNEYNDIVDKPENYKANIPEVVIPVDNNTPKEKFIITTKNGDREFEIGTEYVLGKVTRYDKNGSEIYSQPKFIVLQENEDGTLKIQDNKGIRDISKKEFENYSVVASEEMLKNKKYKYMQEMQNVVFKNFLIKKADGSPTQGRLEYSNKDNMLVFAYVDEKGVVRRKIYENKFFKEQEGFDKAAIRPFTKLKALSQEEQNSQEEFLNSQERKLTEQEKQESIAKKLERRNEIITELYDKNISRLETINNKLNTASESFLKQEENLKKQLELESKTKKGELRKRATPIMAKLINSLATLKSNVDSEITQLENEKEELENSLPFLKQFQEDLENQPENSNTMLKNIKKDISLIEQYIDITEESIKKNTTILEDINNLLNNALELFNDYIKRLKEENPKIPLGIELLEKQLEKYLGEEGVKIFIAEKQGFTEQVIELEVDINSFSEDLNIPKLSSKAENISKSLKELSNLLKDLQSEKNAKQQILESFEKIITEEAAKKRKIEKFESDVQLGKEMVGTLDVSQQIISGENTDEGFEKESKKEALVVITSTIGRTDNKELNLRAQRFGNRFHQISEEIVPNLRTITVTEKTEGIVSLKGLAKEIITDEDGTIKNTLKSEEVIATVVVVLNEDGTISLVNEFGEKLTEEELKEPLKHIIAQVYPGDKLMQVYDNGYNTMFRADVSNEDKIKYTKQYKVWREKQLLNENISKPQEFTTSFGIVQFVEDENGNTDYNTTTPILETELITKEDLKEKQLIEISDKNEITVGNTTFKTSPGRVFLKIANGLIKLNNRKLNTKESENIFNALLQLSKISLEKGSLKDNTEADSLINWLKTIVYWGIPNDSTGKTKNAGFNNIWFQKVKDENTGKFVNKLFVSGKGLNFSFTPSSIEANKTVMLSALSEMYHNIYLQNLKKEKTRTKYKEIISFENGTPIFKTWNNYQSYLLSNEGRENNQTPLSTIVIPKNQTLNGLVREGIYFTVIDNNSDFDLSYNKTQEETKKEQVVENEITENKNILEVDNSPDSEIVKVNKTSSIDSFIKDDKTSHLYTTPFGNVKIKISSENDVTILDAEIETKETIAKVASSFKKEYKEALDTIKISISKVLEPHAEIVAIQTETLPSTQNKTEEVKSPRLERNRNIERNDDNAYRIVTNRISEIVTENFEEVEKWIKSVLPNIPVYRVKNAIEATNGKQAWGMLHQGAIYLYENAEQGTAYHEVFEAVWAMTTTQLERDAVIKDFRNRKGTYKDRFNGNAIAYSEATKDELREELAEEFRDYILYSKYPEQIENASNSFLSKIFKDILDFLKSFFLGKEATINTTELFKRIGNGYYKQHLAFEEKLSIASKGIIDINSVTSDSTSTFRLNDIENISVTEVHQIMQAMTQKVLVSFVKEGKSVFEITELQDGQINDLYKELKDYVLDNNLGAILDKLEAEQLKNPDNITNNKKLSNYESLYVSIRDQWSLLVKKHKQYIKSYNINFDESDIIDYDNYEKPKDEGYGDARTMDAFAKLNSGLKLFLSTIQEMEFKNNKLEPVINNIGGINLLPLSAVYSDLMEQLSKATGEADMIEKLKIAAKNNPNYINLFRRLFGIDPITDQVINYNLLKNHDIQLIKAFNKAFLKTSPDVKLMTILPSGEIVIGDSSSAGAAKDNRIKFTNKIIQHVTEEKNPYIKQNKVSGRYFGTSEFSKLNEFNPTPETAFKFFNQIGIDFTLEQLKILIKNPKFEKAMNGIISSFRKQVFNNKEGLIKLNDKTLNISGNFLELGIMKANLEKSEFEMTYFNVNGQRSQTYIGTNWMSYFHNVVTNVSNKEKLRNNEFGYLITDVFSQGSIILDKLFSNTSGKNIKLFDNLLKPVIVDGINDQILGKSTDASKLNSKQRILLETNMNINGIYMNLVPGDGQAQTAITLHEKGNEFINEDSIRDKDYQEIFKNYLLSEIELAKENRPVSSKKNNKDLRFFKTILSEKTHNTIVKLISQKETGDVIYEKLEKEINNELEKYIEDLTEESIDAYKELGVIESSLENNKFNVTGISYFNTENTYDADFIKVKMKMLELNFMIANIELHKLMYSDPYQYSGELKRIKSFTSPRNIIANTSPEVNKQLQVLFTDPEETNPDFIENFERNNILGGTMSDVNSINEELNYEAYEETDGGGLITDKGLRYLRLKEGTWAQENENQYNYNIAFMKTILLKTATKEEIESKKYELTTIQKQAFKKGDSKNQNNDTPYKPIVAGDKNMGREYNDLILDKFALFPISFKMLYEINPDANLIKLYKNMINSETGTDYMIHSSGRKIGAENVYELYDENGNFNEKPLRSQYELDNPIKSQTVLTIPLSIFGIQSEVPTKELAKVTQGSQPTKLSTMDFMSNGIPIDFLSEEKNESVRYTKWSELKDKFSYNSGDNLYKEILLNKELLEARIENGLDQLFKKFNIVEKENGQYAIDNKQLTIDFFKKELTNRDVSDNILQALDGYENGELVLEAIPSYQQIRNILYSVAHKMIVSPKITGGQRVQISSMGFESGQRKTKIVKDKNEKETRVFESDVLGFYKNKKGQQVCEIMLSKWFKSSTLDDKALLEYLNETLEGQKLLMGVAFRIPTQKQNSIEIFKIKQFLPDSYKDSVIVPSALVKKVGSDFDIDKLFIYLKSVYETKDGEFKQVPYFGTGVKAIERITKAYKNGEFNDYILNKKSNLPLEQGTPEDRLANSIFYEEALRQEKEIVNSIYRESLDNAYIESFERLVSNTMNFENLIKPNSAEQLIEEEKELSLLLGNEEIDYENSGNMLNRRFMSALRHDLVQGKYNIGIAATTQTNNSQFQKTEVTIDYSKLNLVSVEDLKYLKDGQITFKNYNQINGKPTLSKINDSKRENITSDLVGQIIDGFVDVNKDPWIMRLGFAKNTAGTWLFLIRLGVPFREIKFFMNQPIVREHLKNLINNGVSSVFSQTEGLVENYRNLLKNTKSKIDVNSIVEIPNEESLKEMVGKKATELSAEQLANQLFIFQEFLKYSKMAEHLLKVTQATNFDTSTFNDPFLVFKKYMQIKAARNTIFSDVDDILDKTFMGVLAKATSSFRDAFSEILTSDSFKNPNGTSIRETLEQVLMPYISMNDSDFVSIAKKAVYSLFDWAVQTETKVNTQIKRVMLSDENGTSIATKIIQLKTEALKDSNHQLHNNYLLKQIEIEKGQSLGEVDNLYITAKDNKVYDQNQIIFAFKEIKKYLTDNNNKELYDDLIRLSVLQSGLQNSKLSFSNLIPFEDFIVLYNKTLSTIDKMSNLQEFVDTDIFERSNYNDSNIVTSVKEAKKYNVERQSMMYFDRMIPKNIKEAINEKIIPNVIAQSYYKGEIISYTYTDVTIPALKIKEMQKAKDYSYIKKGLYKIVYIEDENGQKVPFIFYSQNDVKMQYPKYIYKAINALGDSIYAKEYYNSIQQGGTTLKSSIINNGYDKITNEVEDVEIVNLFPQVEQIEKNKEIDNVSLTTENEFTPEQLGLNTNTTAEDFQC